MDASSRAPALPPLKTGPLRASTSTSTLPETIKSTDTSSVRSIPLSLDSYCASPGSASTGSPLLWGHKSSRYSPSSAEGSANRKPVPPRKVNANSYCGRHSDEFLFGGKGLGDLWRAVTRK